MSLKTLVREGVAKVSQIELPAEQVKSLARCDEVVTYHRVAAKTMLPTLQPNERVVIDTISYQERAPQRGEIVAVRLSSTSTERAELSIERIIGLPGEKIRIAAGRVYVNDLLFGEDYTIAPTQQQYPARIVPANRYLLWSDNLANPALALRLVARETIVGKVVWQFGNQ